MAAQATFVRVRLNPIAGGRLPFPAQLLLGLALVAYGLAFILTENRPEAGPAPHVLHYVFMGFTIAYLGYVVARSAPLFGTQSYLELTPDYLVHKPGLFRPKTALGAEEISGLELTARTLRINRKAGPPHEVNLRQVRGPRKRERLRTALTDFAQRHRLPLNG